MSTSDLIRTIQDIHPKSSVTVSVYDTFVVVSVIGLPTLDFPEQDSDEWPNNWAVSWHNSHAPLTVGRYGDRDIDAALNTALSVISAPKVVPA